MLETRSVYKTLGLKEDAGREEVERKYNMLIKRYRMEKMEGSAEAGQKLEEIGRAYRTIVDGELNEAIEAEENKIKTNPLLKRVGLDERKARNFLYYHKFHIIISIILVVLLATTLKSCIFAVKPDLNVVFLGDFVFDNTTTMTDKIKTVIPLVKEPTVDVITLAANAKSEYDFAMAQKAMAVMAAGDSDIFILDKQSFELYGKQGSFINLDILANDPGIDKEKSKDFTFKAGDDTDAHLYGIDISGSEFFKDMKISGKEMIAAVKFNAPHKDSAIKLIKYLMK